MQRAACTLTVPSLADAATVFACGWLPVSPFASWPAAAWVVPALPATVPFVAFVIVVSSRGARPSGGRRRPWELPETRSGFELLDAFDRRSALVIGPVVALVAVSFLQWVASQTGTAELVDGRYVLMERGEVLANLTRREWLELRTDESRVMTGHFIVFGLVGQLGLRGATRTVHPVSDTAASRRDQSS